MTRLCCTRFERAARKLGWTRIAGLDEAFPSALREVMSAGEQLHVTPPVAATGDADCSAWDQVQYFYASRSSNGFKPLTHSTGKRPRDMLFTNAISSCTRTGFRIS